MLQKREFALSEHYPSIHGDSKYLILCISMYNGMVMQDETENEVFLNPKYKCLNEKLKIFDEEAPYDRLIKPEERVDQMVNFFRLIQMKWKDRFHEFKIMGTFIETIMKTFNFKMELCIHDLVWNSKEICMLHTGFRDDTEEESAPLFEIYHQKDFKNKDISKFFSRFFSMRKLKFERKQTEPENFRLGDFLEEEREGVQLYGISLFVNRGKFLNDFENREEGLLFLKNLLDEFYAELEHVFEVRNAIDSIPNYQREEDSI